MFSFYDSFIKRGGFVDKGDNYKKRDYLLSEFVMHPLRISTYAKIYIISENIMPKTADQLIARYYKNFQLIPSLKNNSK